MYIRASVTPGAKKETVLQTSENRLSISVKEKAENNMANSRVLAIIKEHFPNAKKIKIVNGHHSRIKLISLDIEEW